MIQKFLFRSLRDQSLSRITYHTFVRSFVRHFPSTNSVEERNFRISSPTILHVFAKVSRLREPRAELTKVYRTLHSFVSYPNGRSLSSRMFHTPRNTPTHVILCHTRNFHSRCIALFRVSYIRFYLVYGTLLNSSAPKTRQEPLVHIH